MTSPTPPNEPQGRPAGSPASSPEITPNAQGSPRVELPGSENSDNSEPGGGIFSTPELTVETENVPNPEAEPSQDNQSRIAAAFQKHDASGRRRAAEARAARERELQDQARWDQNVSEQNLQNQAARDMNAAALVASDIPSTATGDIRLPGEKKKRKKAPLIIALAALVLVVGGVGVWWGVRGGEKETAPTNSLSNVTKDFSRYANYLLFGEEKPELGGEYESGNRYTLNQQIESAEYNQAYWDKASELLGISVEALSRINDSAKDRLMEVAKNYQDNFDFIMAYKRAGKFDEEGLLLTFLSSGMDAASQAIDSFYAEFPVSKSSAAASYVEQKKQQYKDVLDIYNMYNELGCIQDGTFNEASCVTPSVTQQNRVMSLSESLARNSQLADDTLKNTVQYLESYCWDLNSWLKDPGQFEESAGE